MTWLRIWWRGEGDKRRARLREENIGEIGIRELEKRRVVGVEYLDIG